MTLEIKNLIENQMLRIQYKKLREKNRWPILEKLKRISRKLTIVGSLISI